MFLVITIFIATFLLGLWMNYFSPKKSKTTEFEFRDLSYEHFIAVSTYASEELKWGLIYLDRNEIRFVTNRSIGSYGEEVSLQMLNSNKAIFYSTYIHQKVGFNQLERNEKRFVQMFNQCLKELSIEDLDNIFEAVIESYKEFYDAHYKEEEDWSEV